MRFPALILTVAAVPLLSHGAIIFSEDFEGATADAYLTTGNTDFDIVNASATGLSFTATTDTGNIFGNGTSNIYNQTIDNDGASISIRENGLSTVSLGDLVTYSVSYRYTGSNTGFDFRIALIDDATTSTNYNARANGGDLTSFSGFSSATTYRFDLVANNTGSALTNYYGDEDLATGTYDLFVTSLDGTFQVQVKDDAAFVNFPTPGDSDNDGFDSVTFQTFNAASGVALAWDDVEVRNDAFVTVAVPEPSAVLLGALGLLALLRRRRA